MRPIFFITIILLLLTACGAAAPQVTVTSEVTVTLAPAATLTVSPTFTQTPTSAAIPTLTPDQQAAMDTANAEFAASGWEAQANGEVTGAPEGVTYNVERGVFTRTYMYEGIELTVDLTINTKTPMPEGAKLNFEGWVVTPEGTLARKTFSSEHGYGYEGDGKGGEPLLNIAESQDGTLADESKVDMTSRELDSQSMWVPFANSRGEFEYGYMHGEPLKLFYWGSNRVPVSNDKGEVILKNTTAYEADGLKDHPITIIRYWGSDHKTDPTALPKILLVDNGEIVAGADDPDHTMKNTYPESWSDEIYGDHKVKVEW
jgi:hypothetical protein